MTRVMARRRKKFGLVAQIRKKHREAVPPPALPNPDIVDAVVAANRLAARSRYRRLKKARKLELRGAGRDAEREPQSEPKIHQRQKSKSSS
jgi:hypothetical protein